MDAQHAVYVGVELLCCAPVPKCRQKNVPYGVAVAYDLNFFP